MMLGANVVQITSSGVSLFGGLAILRLLLFSTQNVSSIRIFARGNPGAARTALKMYAFSRTKYLRIAAGLGIRYPFKISKLNYIYAACFFRFRCAGYWISIKTGSLPVICRISRLRMARQIRPAFWAMLPPSSPSFGIGSSDVSLINRPSGWSLMRMLTVAIIYLSFQVV